MGGTVIIIATLIGYFAAHLFISAGRLGVTATGLLLLFLFVGMGVVGFLDDFIKIRKQRSLGLNKTGEAGRPARSSASRSRSWRCSSRTATG